MYELPGFVERSQISGSLVGRWPEIEIKKAKRDLCLTHLEFSHIYHRTNFRETA